MRQSFDPCRSRMTYIRFVTSSAIVCLVYSTKNMQLFFVLLSKGTRLKPLLFRRFLATPAGLEPATLCLEGRCSIQLSYGAAGKEIEPKVT